MILNEPAGVLHQGCGPLVPDSALALARGNIQPPHGAWGMMTALQIDTKNRKAILDLKLKVNTTFARER